MRVVFTKRAIALIVKNNRHDIWCFEKCTSTLYRVPAFPRTASSKIPVRPTQKHRIHPASIAEPRTHALLCERGKVVVQLGELDVGVLHGGVLLGLPEHHVVHEGVRALQHFGGRVDLALHHARVLDDVADVSLLVLDVLDDLHDAVHERGPLHHLGRRLVLCQTAAPEVC